MRTLSDEDLAAIVTALSGESHCSFTEEERVVIKKFVRFLDRTASKIGTVFVLVVLGSMAAMWHKFGGG